MRAVQITLLVLITAGLIRYVTAGEPFAAGTLLPFCDGRVGSLDYPIGKLLLLLMWIYAIIKTLRRNNEDS